MATNFFFNNFQNSMEQNLIEDLVIESIKIYGLDIFYLPRTIVNRDEIFNEDSVSKYDKAVGMEMYIRNVEGFEGEGDFLSRFGVEIRDQITFSVARRTFESETTTANIDRDRPQEGDIVYFPLNKKYYQIKFVEHEPVFYQMGSLQFYDIKCELFEYSNEVFDTGIDVIDSIQDNLSTDTYDHVILLEDGSILIDETSGLPIVYETFKTVDEVVPEADNEEIETAADAILDFSETDPFSDGGRF